VVVVYTTVHMQEDPGSNQGLAIMNEILLEENKASQWHNVSPEVGETTPKQNFTNAELCCLTRIKLHPKTASLCFG
jgi:hypothetical protein